MPGRGLESFGRAASGLGAAAVGVTAMTDPNYSVPRILCPAISATVLALAVLALAACDKSPTAPTVGLNQEFVLAPGEAATIAGAGISIRFVGVLGDSRCPADVVCILGGDAIVRINVLSFGGGRYDYDLHTGDLRPVVHRGFTIALVNVVPYPFSSQTIRPKEYRVTLRVTG